MNRDLEPLKGFGINFFETYDRLIYFKQILEND